MGGGAGIDAHPVTFNEQNDKDLERSWTSLVRMQRVKDASSATSLLAARDLCASGFYAP